MATLIIPDLDDAVRERLRVRAEERGRSVEEEARWILEDAIEEAEEPVAETGSAAALWKRLRAGLPEHGVDFGEFPDTPYEPPEDIWGEAQE